MTFLVVISRWIISVKQVGTMLIRAIQTRTLMILGSGTGVRLKFLEVSCSNPDVKCLGFPDLSCKKLPQKGLPSFCHLLFMAPSLVQIPACHNKIHKFRSEINLLKQNLLLKTPQAVPVFVQKHFLPSLQDIFFWLNFTTAQIWKRKILDA